MNLSYQTASNQLSPDGTTRSLFYDPAAMFSLAFGISLDAIYERMTGPRREIPFILMAKNRVKTPADRL